MSETKRTMREIFSDVASRHGLSIADLKGRCRTADVSRARHRAMTEAYDAGFSSSRIGRALGRDHTTVLYGIERHRGAQG